MLFMSCLVKKKSEPSRKSSENVHWLKRNRSAVIMSDQSIVLSFHETLLHQSDVDLLKGPLWLNDTIISFYFEYLERVMFGGVDKLLFVSPEVTQCIKMVSAEEIGIFLDPLGAQNKEFVFFALNDNHCPEMAGGSHWSLLVFSKPERSFFHLDSSDGSNDDVAREFSRHLTRFFSKKSSISFVRKPCAQQSNGYDCGVYVAIYTERLAEHARAHHGVASCDTDVPADAAHKRAEILSVIHQLAEKS